MGSVEIYKTSKNYKILTQYKLESGSYISSEPIFILPIDVNKEEMESKLFEALEASRDLSESEEDDFWLGNKLLKKLKESSFDKLYKSSCSCHVSLIDGIFSITPQKYVGKNVGLDILEDRAVKFFYDNNRSEVLEKITQVLLKK